MVLAIQAKTMPGYMMENLPQPRFCRLPGLVCAGISESND